MVYHSVEKLFHNEANLYFSHGFIKGACTYVDRVTFNLSNFSSKLLYHVSAIQR